MITKKYAMAYREVIEILKYFALLGNIFKIYGNIVL